MRSLLIGAISAILTIAILGVAIYTFVAKLTDTAAIQIEKVQVEDGQILHVKGDFTESARQYAGYTFDIMDGKFYLRMKTVLAGGQSGGFDFTIKDPNLANVEAIYLQGTSSEDQVLLWTLKKKINVDYESE
ncbi:hypothetical protein JFL43_00135 [Viridibacillus sp. YIM B01967]|uniref:Uncharacterized protein n=1 Tax=Viridibacillus soli TaxID=2798301 RepID=A0ABS1H1L1_9BACL|nr:hypothetical protein [Viridibacillus soli]MBK3493299.1 hypothetical protein [Viridibacillus soli]